MIVIAWVGRTHGKGKEGRGENEVLWFLFDDMPTYIMTFVDTCVTQFHQPTREQTKRGLFSKATLTAIDCFSSKKISVGFLGGGCIL